MLKDNVVVWVLEYVFGGALVVAPMTGMVIRRRVSIDSYTWAALLFVACLGVVLISCASSMRQRMLLAKRIETLTEQIQAPYAASQESAADSEND